MWIMKLLFIIGSTAHCIFSHYVDLCESQTGYFEAENSTSPILKSISLFSGKCTSRENAVILILKESDLLIGKPNYLTACDGSLNFITPSMAKVQELCMFETGVCIALLPKNNNCLNNEILLGCKSIYYIPQDNIFPLNISYSKNYTARDHGFKMKYALTSCNISETKVVELHSTTLKSTTQNIIIYDTTSVAAEFGILFGITLVLFILTLIKLYQVTKRLKGVRRSSIATITANKEMNLDLKKVEPCSVPASPPKIIVTTEL
uniref:uncharacterized protein LOC120332469 n=1 Tax=Styela clava TaxID=7725 RepID=UPI0019399BD4|nr:uncharacterized protein LOC120332469 [Styela clava]